MLSRSLTSSGYQFDPNKLSCGSYGEVYAGKNVINEQPVVLKRISYNRDDGIYEILRLLREVSILRYLKGIPNIVSLEGVWMSETYIDLIFPRSHADLAIIIDNKKSFNGLTLERRQSILYQILLGIEAVHSKNLVHRDLKPSNILINNDCSVKICDFGLARAITNSETKEDFKQLSSYVVTRWYRSPELILNEHRAGGPASDMWSIGCILGELFSGVPIFRGEDSINVLDRIVDLTGKPEREAYEAWLRNKESLAIFDAYPNKQRQNFQSIFPMADLAALDMLTRLLELNPFKRMTAAQGLRHSFVEDFYCQEDFDAQQALQDQRLGSTESMDYWRAYMNFESMIDKLSPSKDENALEKP